MTSSVWPNDYLNKAHILQRDSPYEYVIFLASPFAPKEKYDDLYKFCKSVCKKIENKRKIRIRCERADSPNNSNVIHQDIWNYIQYSDVIIFDISDKNPNVMFELGVAGTLRDKDHIILIRDKDCESKPNIEGTLKVKDQTILIKDQNNNDKNIFDIAPVRYLSYNRFVLYDEFEEKLINALEFSLAPAPYKPQDYVGLQLPINITIEKPKGFSYLLCPGPSHKRYTTEGLEFGSLFLYEYSWLTLGEKEYDNIHIKSEMKFLDKNPQLQRSDGWIGISPKSTHFAANFEHLLYVKADGTIILTQPLNSRGAYRDKPLGKLKNFDITQWIRFDILLNHEVFKIQINDFKVEFDLKDKTAMPYCYNSGVIRFQTYLVRACIKSVYAEIPK